MGLLERRLLIGTPSAYASVAAQTEELVSKVAAVAEGNTMIVLDVDLRQHEVRLQALDAPREGAKPLARTDAAPSLPRVLTAGGGRVPHVGPPLPDRRACPA